MSALARKWLALSVLTVWTAPSLAFASTAFHVAFGHEAGHAAHSDEVAHLAILLTHGHRHDVAAPEHAHDAPLPVVAPLPRPFMSAGGPGIPPIDSDSVDRLSIDPRSERGPPVLLFTNHCSLLL